MIKRLDNAKFVCQEVTSVDRASKALFASTALSDVNEERGLPRCDTDSTIQNPSWMPRLKS
jgi:hypothetical protein